jgi:hypothetical protein
MDYEVVPDRHTPDVWRVEWTVDENEGTFCVAIFSGPDAKALAGEYAAWKSETAGRQLVGSAGR